MKGREEGAYWSGAMVAGFVLFYFDLGLFFVLFCVLLLFSQLRGSHKPSSEKVFSQHLKSAHYQLHSLCPQAQPRAACRYKGTVALADDSTPSCLACRWCMEPVFTSLCWHVTQLD